MCRPVRCKQCGKTTWAGCGMHVATVKASVAPIDWCGGHPRDSAEPRRPLLRRIFGG